MLFLLAKNENFWLCLMILTSLACLRSSVDAIACNASSIKSCSALLNYVPETPTSIEETASLFHVSTDSVHKTLNASVVAISCGCAGYQHDEFTYHTLYTVKPGDTWDVISSKFGFLVVEKPDKALIPTMNITLDILCGCYEHMEILTYRIERGDTLYTICTRFGASADLTAKVNKLKNQNLIYAGELLYIPNPESLKYLTVPYAKDSNTKRLAKSQIYIIIGTTVAAVAIVLLLGTFIFWKYYYKSNRPSKAYLMRYLPCDLTSMPSYAKSEGNIVLSVSSDRATDFPYSEVSNATVNFSTSRKIGQGSYGSVYLGNLRGQDVAIKQMKNTKSREFQSEINTLCNVHHSNLIQLIGYAAGGDSLFLVYEFAQNGALSEHLHNPSVRGYKPLSWVTRVQIAVDAAQGLEYIHVHTKPYYVHRDVKTSNILLDSQFRAKIADFGLAKLLEKSADTGTTASRLVGTFGYLAPEYVRDGCLTAKSDVYAFGVVLMELITGQPALRLTASSIHIQSGEHRSLVDYMISALECNDPMAKLTKHIDPELSYYHKDSLLLLAFLSRDCVDDDWKRRPDMTKVVLYLSQILTRTKEWQQTNCTDQNA